MQQCNERLGQASETEPIRILDSLFFLSIYTPCYIGDFFFVWTHGIKRLTLEDTPIRIFFHG
jgi:hypothetical protein